MSLHQDGENQHEMRTTLAEAEVFAPVDRIDPANDDDDELNPDGAVMQDDSTNKRSRKLTEKGLCLKKSTLHNKRKKMNARLLRQAGAKEDLMYTYKSMVTVAEEIAQYDYTFKQLLLVHEKYHSLLDEPDKCNDDEWFEEVDERVFTFKHKVHNWLKDAEVEQGHSSKRSSKIGSKSASYGSLRRTKPSSSKSSREKALEEKAKLAEIMTEAEFPEKRQLAENQPERLKIQEKVAKAKARSEVYSTMQDHAFVKNEVATNEEFKRDQAASNTKITTSVHQQILKPQMGQSSYKGEIDASNTLKGRTIKSYSKKSCDRISCAADAQARSTLLPKVKDFDGEMSRMLCGLLRQQSAPDVDIQTFRGDPLKYHFFMSSFREAVERKVDDSAPEVHRWGSKGNY